MVKVNLHQLGSLRQKHNFAICMFIFSFVLTKGAKFHRKIEFVFYKTFLKRFQFVCTEILDIQLELVSMYTLIRRRHE